MNIRPLIGVTPDIDFAAAGNPPRDFYTVDARNFLALREVGATALIVPHDTSAIDAYLDLVGGVLVTGGGYQFDDPKLFRFDGSEPPEKVARGNFELALIRGAIARDKPLLAVCGGFQLLNLVAGGELVTSLKDADPAFERHRGASFTELVHPVQAKAGSRLAAIVGGAPFQVNTRHRQGVLAAGAGSGAVPSGMSDDGVVEAIELPGQRFCIGVQWHPEFFLTPADRRLFEAFVDASRG